MDLIIKNGTIVSPTATFKADVCVDNGKIVAITADAGTDADKVVDASGKMVLPGAIDAHTHLAMPFGGTISSDDYYAGTRAAACGGTTTVFDFILQDLVKRWSMPSSAVTHCALPMRLSITHSTLQ